MRRETDNTEISVFMPRAMREKKAGKGAETGWETLLHIRWSEKAPLRIQKGGERMSSEGVWEGVFQAERTIAGNYLRNITKSSRFTLMRNDWKVSSIDVI